MLLGSSRCAGHESCLQILFGSRDFTRDLCVSNAAMLVGGRGDRPFPLSFLPGSLDFRGGELSRGWAQPPPFGNIAAAPICIIEDSSIAEDCSTFTAGFHFDSLLTSTSLDCRVGRRVNTHFRVIEFCFFTEERAPTNVAYREHCIILICLKCSSHVVKVSARICNTQLPLPSR